MTKLKLNGKPFNLHPPKPTVAKMLAFLEKAPADELFTMDELSKRLGMGHGSVQNAREPELIPYRSDEGRGKRTLWGSKRAIAELRRQLATQ